MKKLLLIPAMLMAFSAYAQDTDESVQEETPTWTLTINRQNPSNYWPTYDLSKNEALSELFDWDVYTTTVELPLLNEEQTHTFRFNFKNNILNKTVNYAEGNGSSYNNLTWNPGDPKEITVFAWTEDNSSLKVMLTGLPYHISDDKWSTMGYFPPLVNLPDNYTTTIYFNNYKGNSSLNFLHGTQPSSKPENFTAGGNRGTISGDRPTKACIYEASLNYSTGKVTLSEATDFKFVVDKMNVFSFPVNVKISEGVKVYTLSRENDKLKASLFEDDEIPANTPVLVVTENSGQMVTFNIQSDIINPDGGTGYKTIKDGDYNYIPDVEYSLEDVEGSNSLFKGVYQQHQLPSNSDCYIFNASTGAFELTRSTVNGGEELSTSSFVVPAFSAYIQLDDEEWTSGTDLSRLEIVFPSEEEEPIEPDPTEPEDMIYVHFTDADGNYTSTFVNGYFGEGPHSCLTKQQDGSYSLAWVVFPTTPTYYVLSKYPYPTSVVEEDDGENENEENEISLMAYDPSSWANFSGTIYHNGGEIDPSEDNVIPFSQEAGNYQITFDPNDESEEGPAPELIESVVTGINNVEINKAENEVMYNIFGMPVDENYKGIVIKNGKKMILR